MSLSCWCLGLSSQPLHTRVNRFIAEFCYDDLDPDILRSTSLCSESTHSVNILLSDVFGMSSGVCWLHTDLSAGRRNALAAAIVLANIGTSKFGFRA